MIKTCLDALSSSLNEMRTQVSNVRYGEPGKILFEFKGESFWSPEPLDVMPAHDNKGNNSEESRSWALKQVLGDIAKRIQGKA